MKKDQEEIKIEKMVLNIEGEKVNLTMEQAKKLKKILDDLFGKEVIKEIHTEHHYKDWFSKPYYWSNVWAANEKSGMLGDVIYCSNNTLECKV